MRKKSKPVALAMVAGALAVSGPFEGCSSSSSTSGGDAGADGTATSSTCGNGILEPGEQCDPKMAGVGLGCNGHCNWICIPDTFNGDATCDDHNPCNGKEWCAGVDAGPAAHTCAKGMPLADGTACGSAQFCHGQMCVSAVCGNGILEPGEECDLGSNNGMGTGCESTCKFTCVSSDPTRNCPPANSCVQAGTCNDSTHACAIGASVTDGTSCGTANVCKAGACVPIGCGDGIKEANEECDFGPGNGIGTGCEADCKFSCRLSPNNCITADPCAGTYTCTAITMGGSPGQKCEFGTPPAPGTGCPNGGTCRAPSPDASGAAQICATANCGNGRIDSGEQCDWGSANNATGSGCEPDCTFTCSANSLASNACANSDPCSVAPQTCQPVAGPPDAGAGNGGQKCAAGPVLAACAPCMTPSGGASGAICVNNVCRADFCGDSCVVPPEQCDPPNGTTCSPTCQAVVTVCGDGIREGAEQCDDGNVVNLDGCDSQCRFELEQRTTSLLYYNATDTFCTENALGTTVITVGGLGVIQQGVTMDVGDGTTNVIFKLTSPEGGASVDLTGTSGPVMVGSLFGTVVNGDAGAYVSDNGANVDWWYTVDPSMIDGNRNPLSWLTGTFTNKTLSAATTGSNRVTMKMYLSGSPARLDLWGAKMQTAVGNVTAPLTSTGAPPGHSASEHIDPALTAFESGGSSSTPGELCGNVTADSLSRVSAPPTISAGGAAPCDENYSATSNTLLDILVHGCKVQGMAVIAPSQPDKQDPSVTFPSGTAGPYALSASTGSMVVDACKDASSTPVPLATCLQGRAFSSAFQFQTTRVIVK